jgi:hypothetical protein
MPKVLELLFRQSGQTGCCTNRNTNESRQSEKRLKRNLISERVIVLAIAIALLSTLGGVYAWSVKIRTAALESHAIQVSVSWMRTIQRGDWQQAGAVKVNAEFALTQEFRQAFYTTEPC